MSEKLSSLKSIRKYCLWCCCETVTEVKLCPKKDCALYPYRLGKSGRVSKMTEEQRKAMSERMRKLKSL
jgi:hypothetical protein